MTESNHTVRRKVVPFLIVLIVFFDQLAKYVVNTHFIAGDSIQVIPGLFNLTYVQNTGAVWGIMAGLSAWISALSVVMLSLIARFHRSFTNGMTIRYISLALLVSGIVGNLIDRIKFKFVIDFLDFYHGEWHFPSFNIADSAICCGVALYIFSEIVGWRMTRNDCESTVDA